LVVLSGPSGCGKATLLKYISDRITVRRVVTYTTREPRPGEVDGIDYNFVSQKQFDRLYEDGALVERETVYGDFYYGSPRDVFGGADTDAIMELDTKGAETYRTIHDSILTIFVLPPSIDELIRRIQNRYPEANLEKRMAAAKPQLESASSYDYIVINDTVQRAGQEILAIIADGTVDPHRGEKLRLAAELIGALVER
jgi:guanylate kinase